MTLTLAEIEKLQPHPAAETVFPPTEAEYQALKASIAESGRVVNPEITVYEGTCLDGNTRLRACRELGRTDLLRIREFDPATDGDPYKYVQNQNEHRRQLSDDQRSEIDRRVEAAVALREEGLTYVEIAEKLGVSEPKVRRLIRRATTAPSDGTKAHEDGSGGTKSSINRDKSREGPGQSVKSANPSEVTDSESPGQEPAGPKEAGLKEGAKRRGAYNTSTPKTQPSKSQPRLMKPRGRSPSSSSPSSFGAGVDEAKGWIRRLTRWLDANKPEPDVEVPLVLLGALEDLGQSIAEWTERA